MDVIPAARLAACLALLPLCAIAGASEFKPVSRVTQVTVYRDGALVTRETKLALPPGDHRILLEEIPSVADPNSVRITGTGSGGLTLGGVEVSQEFRAANLTPEYRQLEGELQALTAEMGALEDRQKAISSLREFLAGLKATAGQESSKDLLARGFAVDSWQKAFQFLSERLNALSAEERGMAPKRQEISEKLEVTRQKLGQLASQGGIQRWTAAVLAASARGGEVALQATYLAHGASWRPLYDAHLEPATGKVELIWQAQVSQNTGEDWKEVDVTLSTTRPAAGIDLPKLASLTLVPASIAGYRQKAAAKEEMTERLQILGQDAQDVLTSAAGVADGVNAAREGGVAGGMVALTTPPAPAEMIQAEAARRDVTVTFDLPGKLNVPSDAQPHRHRVASRDLQGKTEYRTVPRLDPSVFLISRITLTGDIPLLPGKVQHFVGPDLVGSSWMVDRAPGEQFPLSFGPDDRLKAERKPIWRKVEQKGKDDEIDYKFVTTVENHLGADAALELKDRVPISGDERITVSLDEKETTSGFTRDSNEPGILTWPITVSKGGKKEITLRYHVRVPRGWPVPGME